MLYPFKKTISLICFYISLLSFNTQAQKISKQTYVVDFQKIEAHIQLDTITQSINGKLAVSFIPKKTTKTVYLNARGKYVIHSASAEEKIQHQNNKIEIIGFFEKDKKYTINFKYSTLPKKALYFWGWNKEKPHNFTQNKQIWTQGQGKYTSNWLPSIDDMNDKILFDLYIDFDKKYEVIANGILTNKTIKNKTATWHYRNKKPMSSYLVAFAIGKYTKKTTKSLTGIPLENYIYTNEINNYEPTYRYHKQIFDFLETEIGVPYPWSVYRQVPVRDFLYAGMENTSCTLFDDDFIIDSTTFNDKNYTSVNAHELAHQWFGNLITETDSKHHWLHEGFATYFALLAEKDIFGDDYFYFKLYENAELLEAQNVQKSSTPLIHQGANSLTYYQRGAWALVALNNYIGSSNFKKSVKLFLNQYAYKNVTTDNFLEIVALVSKKDLSDFSKNWLYNTNFPTKKALTILTKSKFMQHYLRIAGERTQPLIGKYTLLSNGLNFPINPYLGQEIVGQLHNNKSPEAIVLLEKAFNANEPLVSQTLANSLTEIPPSFEPKMRKLLKSNSYATIEAALYNLWNNFEHNKMSYLKDTEHIIGFNNKNVRVLWLTLALNTKGFSTSNRAEFYRELYSYTKPHQPIRLRINAFQKLDLLENFSDSCLQNLALGAVHPSWQFNNFCTRLIKKLLTKATFKNRFVQLKNSFPYKVQQIISTK